MGASLLKDTIREIKGSFGRFFSIMMIVAIGVAFYAGVKASIPDMKHTADQYFDDYHLMDIRLLSTYGFNAQDVEAISQVDGIEGVYATNTVDTLANIDMTQMVLKVHALPDVQKDTDVNYINRPKLVTGRLPHKSGECVIEQGEEMHQSGLSIGDTIRLKSGTDTSLDETLKTTEYTVVGTVHTPYYLSYEKGSSGIGSGKINYFIMVPQSDFIVDYFSEIHVTIQGAREKNSYQDDYFDIIDPVKQALETMAKQREDIRFETIKQEANDTLTDKRKEYEDGKRTFETEIRNHETKLKQAYTELIQHENELKTKQQETFTVIQDAKDQLSKGREQLENSKREYALGWQAFQASKDTFLSQLSQVDEQLSTLQTHLEKMEETLASIKQSMEDPNMDDETHLQLQAQYDECMENKQTLKRQISILTSQKEQMEKEWNAQETKLKETKQQLESEETKLNTHTQTLEERERIAHQEFAKAKSELDKGKREYEQGVIEFQNAKKDGQEDLDIGKEKLEQAEKDIQALKKPEWFVLDRKSHYSYMDYGSVADRMEGIAKVFPLFFFLVAALVCLTTMTRMVDEQRNTIGTLKALGYGKNAIAFKFIAYALIASLFGSVLGCSLGMVVFPTVIFNGWNIMYTLPPISFVAQPMLAFGASAIVSLITVLAAYFAVYKELKETPALLMRPKAPKAGKIIILERMGFLWKHLSFTQKVTARNLFRYKKRFFMTVIGISGCTALLVAGFGIQDSIALVVDKQYGDIFKYDLSLNVDQDATTQEKNAVLNNMRQDARIKDVMGITMDVGTVKIADEEQSVTIVSPSDTQRFQTFVSLHQRSNQEEMALNIQGALISEKLAMNASLSKGDMITFEDAEGKIHQVKINGVIENYVGHYIYVSPETYKQLFGIRQSDTTMIALMNDTSGKTERALGNDLMKMEHVTSISFYRSLADSFSDMISSLSFIVIVLVISAGLLAFVVLYNLTNVNVSERLREIATIKVLGFYDREVAEYVYRENMILTMIGALCGLVLGIGLHRLIMSLAEMENIMFGRNIDLSSFVYSFIITLGFALLVNLVMYRKLKKIPMVESLKSIE